jgi:hypothetical protein
MTNQELEKIINDINKAPIGTPKLPAGGFSSKKRKKWQCGDWRDPGKDILKEVFGNPINKTPVVAVIDSLNNGPDVPLEISEVVIAIGINYGQTKTSGKTVLPYGDTGMRKRLNEVYAELLPWTTTQLLDAEKRGRVVLIATNFFPWLSNIGWRDIELNAIEEMLLIYSFGFADPCFTLTKLVKKLAEQKLVPHLVFHGSNNAVPLMGRTAMESALSGSEFRSVVFCDNLAHGVGIKNAILWQYDRRYLMAKNIKPAQLHLDD